LVWRPQWEVTSPYYEDGRNDGILLAEIRTNLERMEATKGLDQNYHVQDEIIPGLYSKYGHHQKDNHSFILIHSLFPSHPMVWGNVYQASLFPLAALLPPHQQ
jgi:hypothetical protein